MSWLPSSTGVWGTRLTPSRGLLARPGPYPLAPPISLRRPVAGVGPDDDKWHHDTTEYIWSEVAVNPEAVPVREVTLLIRHHGEPESDISADYPDVTIRSRSSMTGRTENRKRIIEVTGDPDVVGSFLDDFAAADPILDLERLTEVGDGRCFVAMTYDAYQWDSIAERLSNLGVHYRNGTVIRGGWERWTLYLDSDDDLGQIVDHIESAGNETRLHREVGLSEVDANDQLDMTSLARDLTDRQTEVLTTAVEMGYYEAGNEASVAEIGERLGISPTTTWEHLNRAERKVMAEVYDFLDSQR